MCSLNEATMAFKDQWTLLHPYKGDPDVSELDLDSEIRLDFPFFSNFTQTNFRYMAKRMMLHGILHDHA